MSGRNPYLIEGPAQISFSGGRSSAMMLCRIVEAHGGTLPEDVFVLFANTGKEREETLVFVRRVAEHLKVAVRWLEYRKADKQINAWTEVDFASAARKGEPLRNAILDRGYMPNPVARICTVHTKLKPMEGFMRAHGYAPTDHTTVIGIRHDEPVRVAKARARTDIIAAMPLADRRVTSRDVTAFCRDQIPFDLALPTINGKTVHGNCDLCYLKGPRLIQSLIREEPTRADWWAAMEAETGVPFRTDRPSYATMKIIAERPGLFDEAPDEDTLPCECTD